MTTTRSRSSSGWGSFTSGIKKGVDDLAEKLTPKPRVKQADDPTSVFSESRPGPGLYVAMARMYAKAGDQARAEEQYRRALDQSPTDLEALLGYARLRDQQGRVDDAIALYQRAATTHPNDASVYNNLGLTCARHRRFDESLGALSRAIALEPKRELYRNNIATVLVEMGRSEAALVNLKAVHREAAAQYNLGYLLQKKGETELARRHFELALRCEPSLVQARQWLAHLEQSASRPRGPEGVGNDVPHVARLPSTGAGRQAGGPAAARAPETAVRMPQRTTSAADAARTAGPNLSGPAPGYAAPQSAPLPPPRDPRMYNPAGSMQAAPMQPMAPMPGRRR